MKENSITYDGVKYALVKDKVGGGCECDRCALVEQCVDKRGRMCCEIFGNEATKDMRFEVVKEETEDGTITEQAAYDEYQERSKVSGDRAEQLAWAMIALLAGQLIGGSAYAEFYVLGGAALLYLLLSAMQSVWQSVAIWLVKCRIKRTGIQLNDYPDWIGFGAWVFYWLKMIIIATGAIYGASHFISFIM